jgi:hypothetical protein
MGIEARNDGAIKAMNCLIVENQFHGVAIGPRGIGYISGNTIEGNGHCRVVDSYSDSTAFVFKNIIV